LCYFYFMLRAFVAIELPGEIQESIARSTASLQKALPKPLVRWVARKNVHLTLKFLGDVSPTNLELLAEALKVEAAQHDCFDMSLGGLGAFPNMRRARVIWIGLEAPPELAMLQRCVEGVATRLGYPAEERPFSPHLTLGRVGQSVSAEEHAKIRRELEACQVGQLGRVHVDALHVFKSDLQPSGSIYTHLYELPLKT
jgi:RNA 2',3'-cyclic 3'-phosphodiesterase